MKVLEVIVLKSSKGQLGIMELFMVIFILFIILGMGMYYFYKFSIAGLEETGEDICIQTTSEQLSSVLNIPEIKCSIQSHARECIDVTKLLAFKSSPTINNSLSRGICKKSMTFIQAYPQPAEEFKEVECTKKNFNDPDYPNNCGKWVIYEPLARDTKNANTELILETPVSLYFPTLREFRVGKLQLKVFLK